MSRRASMNSPRMVHNGAEKEETDENSSDSIVDERTQSAHVCNNYTCYGSYADGFVPVRGFLRIRRIGGFHLQPVLGRRP